MSTYADKHYVWLTESRDGPLEFKIPKREFNADRSSTKKRVESPATRTWDTDTSHETVVHTTSDRDLIQRDLISNTVGYERNRTEASELVPA